MNEPSAAKHLAWCKKRALAYVAAGDLPNAVSSMLSDLGKHPETHRILPAHVLQIGFMHASQRDPDGIRAWIEGFHI